MTDAVRERYDRFAREEAPGRSDVYAQWAAGVAADAEAQDVLQRIRPTHRQPPLVFAVTRLLGAPVGAFPDWRDWLLVHAAAVVAECERRTVQTNEPLRQAALLPALSQIEGPIALLELGAAAGLCLYPDRCSYRFIDERGAVRAELDPDGGPSAVMLTSIVRGALPRLRLPEVVFRAGVDLAPLDVRDSASREWLRALTWPGEHERAQRVEAAVALAAADPPRLLAGDAGGRLEDLLAMVPVGVTPVITTPGMLVYLARADRDALIAQIRSSDARWVTIDPMRLHESWAAPDADGFGLGVDGRLQAHVDPLGRWWEWRAGEERDGA